jgi:hypothetical protein
MVTACGLAYGADRGIYVGGGIGSASADRSGYDNSTDTYKLFAGAQSEGFAVELGYVDLGKFKDSGAGQNFYSVDGVQLNALGEMFLSRDLYGFGSFGFYNWNLEDNSNGNDSGTSVTFGLGLKVMLGDHLFARGGWERFNNIADENSDLLSLSLGYRF